MDEEIKEFDERGNGIHYKNSYGEEYWYKYDENNNLIHYKNSYGYEYWYNYDENNNIIHCKYSEGDEHWYKYENNNKIEITKKEFYKLKEQEFLNREYCSRFELMDI